MLLVSTVFGAKTLITVKREALFFSGRPAYGHNFSPSVVKKKARLCCVIKEKSVALQYKITTFCLLEKGIFSSHISFRAQKLCADQIRPTFYSEIEAM